MDAKQFDGLIEAMLAGDEAVSRAEEDRLRKEVGEAKLTEHKRTVLRARVFDVAGRGIEDQRLRKRLEWVRKVLNAMAPAADDDEGSASEVLFSPGDICVRRITGLFDAARSSADACVFTITDDRISDAILRAHGRGVRVRIVTDNEKIEDPGSDIHRLRGRGVPVSVDTSPFHMHHKFAVFDRAVLVNGSYNWTRGAAQDNEENLVVSSDAGLVKAFETEFEKLWERFSR